MSVFVVALVALGQTGSPDFARTITPLLQRHCLRCHGPSQQQGGLRLDQRNAALRVLVPHNAAASPLYRRVVATNDQRMPPPDNAPLSPAEQETLRRWIDAGPRWPEGKATAAAPVHWSLRSLTAPAVPKHPSTNPIDAFVGARLAAKKLGFSPAADRATLLRRVYFDLVGLPPTPAELSAFLADTRPGAYERIVDRLLASPRYGERWARHWLDTIHYADSHGFEHDIGRDNAWPFRDYVIQALNADTPWPRFIREQLAADYFYPDHPELTPALGFLGAGTFDLSAYTTAPRNFELIDRDDLVTQTMAAFTSTTANCARCHDHKFDPVPQSDYYALQAVFAGLIKGDRTYETTASVAQRRAAAEALRTAAEKRDLRVLLAPEHAATVAAWLETVGRCAPWRSPTLVSVAAAQGSVLTPQADGAIAAGGTRPEVDSYTTTVTSPLPMVTGLRLDVLTSDTLPMRGPGRQDNGNLHLTELDVWRELPGRQPERVAVVTASADFNQDGWGIGRAIDGDPKTAWGIYPAVGKSHYALFGFAAPVALPPGATLRVVLHQNHGGGHLIGLYRLSVTAADLKSLTALPLDVEAALATPIAERTEAQRLTLAAAALQAYADTALAALPAPKRVFAAGPKVDVLTIGMRELKPPRAIHRLDRGNVDKPLEEVGPGALTAVAALPARFALSRTDDDAARRAALAEWLASPKNPLTWRSAVNRVWHYHFGRGLCDTPSDLGKMGGVPSHPELIDWLAVWFRDSAHGSLKRLHRLIVTSQTYRQSSAHRPAASRIDSENRLLWRQNRQRLDADAYRDFALAAAGTLDLTMGGPGVQHFTMRPGPQLTPALDYAAYDWSAKGAARRSIYRYVWRGIADPFMEALDFPDLGLLAPSRTFSVSALQALTLYNNPFVLHCSETLAHAAETASPSLTEQVAFCVSRTLLRPPTAAEQAALTDFARRQGLSALCRVLYNANAFLFID